MRTVLVTGGAGFIGGHLVRQLIDAQTYRVVVVDKLTYAGNLRSLESVWDSPRFSFLHSDICDGPRMLDLLMQHHCDAVINLAAETHVDRSIDSPAPFVQSNVVGTYELLEATRSYLATLSDLQVDRFRFLQVSTDEVYGSLGKDGVFTESTSYSPNSPYSASKAAADHFVRAYHQTYGLPTITTHGCNNYGPFQFPEKLIPLMIQRAVRGEPLPVYGNGKNVREWIHVEDHCIALRLILETGRVGQTYNVGSSTEKTNLEMVRAICDCVDRWTGRSHSSFDQIQWVADRPGHDFRYAIDATKLKHELGWTPQIDFDNGIDQTVKWYLDHPDWTESKTTPQQA
ncbi:dTDP-glucose 4,6-dehydratase 2 [Rubripirellula lacrimiformis]|uniref:dTDP-glucose 4,6-dehydratase n=1 Tax=Rubripirellula lacrimiformis TaxID=1930273 RepID=A0A517NLW5_9BACT|nr:dTDP-glucose 4,6-dehydratase [Rubripirellula lacrimiformis]QDT08063.1 dTDP-glucose 4,6-dehydratase 2 [Rubripirellula lacrimiformis]